MIRKTIKLFIFFTSHKVDATTFDEEDAEMLRQADLEWEQNLMSETPWDPDYDDTKLKAPVYS